MNTNGKEQFVLILSSSIENQEFVKLTLSKYRGQEESLDKIIAKVVRLKSGLKISLTYCYKTQEIVKNHLVSEGVDLISNLIGNDFMSGRLFTIKQDMQIDYDKHQEAKIHFIKPTFTDMAIAIPQGHDRQKKRLIESSGNPYLTALGITNKQGEIVKTMESKFRQINKFIEIIQGLVESSGLLEKDHISVVDMGAGKGYLTFALYDFLSHRLHKPASIIGIESRKNLVDFCNSVAISVEFENLHFQQGDIRSYEAKQTDMTIALHACDTATDDAIYQGIQSQSALIILAPCCHKQIRKQVHPNNAGLKNILKYGILLERQAEIVTDGLRGLLLELAGYETKIFEFISPEHTNKNIMIVGIKSDRHVDKNHLLEQIKEIKHLYGIDFHYLENRLFPGL
jgi:SAM-dependent methyltransferase